MSEDCANIIDLLIARRHSLGMTQNDLAKATGFTQSVIARMENKKSSPLLDTLLKVAIALDCNITVVPANSTQAPGHIPDAGK